MKKLDQALIELTQTTFMPIIEHVPVIPDNEHHLLPVRKAE